MMKTKIKWNEPAKPGLDADLPNGYYAEIISLRTDKPEWVWAILDKDLCEIKKGIEPTLPEAKNKCQEAWDEINAC